MICEIGGKWLYISCFVGCRVQNFFETARSILACLPSNFFSTISLRVNLVHLYGSTETVTVLKETRFILTEKSDFYIIDYLSIAIRAFVRLILKMISVDEILLPRYVNLPTNFRGLPLKVDMKSCFLKYKFYFICVHFAANACGCLETFVLRWSIR